MNLKKHTAFFISLIFLSSCNVHFHVSASKDNNSSKNEIAFTIKNTKIETYQGWWIFGEGQHIFKDEKTLGEYRLEFPKENMHDLNELYLAICEIEYFPMECKMIGRLEKDLSKNESVLVVNEFEILYIEGCE
tara:strand:+ start:108 stop:506 length:399 start_codon:yes stop_codon:yes gene_type:complete